MTPAWPWVLALTIALGLVAVQHAEDRRPLGRDLEPPATELLGQLVGSAHGPWVLVTAQDPTSDPPRFQALLFHSRC